MLVEFRELVSTVAHIGHDLQAELLRLFRLTVMLSSQSDQAFGQTDETDAQRPLVNHRSYRIVGLQLLASQPKRTHHQRELLGKGCLLELHTLMQLTGRDFQHVVELGKETSDTFFFIYNLHALDGQTHDVDG